MTTGRDCRCLNEQYKFLPARMTTQLREIERRFLRHHHASMPDTKGRYDIAKINDEETIS
jgi:hypothetical protein